jgi:hypothetical protein
MYLAVPTNWVSRLSPVIGSKIITELSSTEDLPYPESEKPSNRRAADYFGSKRIANQIFVKSSSDESRAMHPPS